MRMLLILLLLGSISSAGFSQLSYKMVTAPQTSSIPDTVIQRFKDEWKKNRIPEYGMPNAIQVKPKPNIYKGNNGQGFDIYESPIDNMSILKPDSSFISDMPVDKSASPERPVYVPNVNLPALKEYLEQKKMKDMGAPKPWEPKVYRVPKK